MTYASQSQSFPFSLPRSLGLPPCSCLTHRFKRLHLCKSMAWTRLMVSCSHAGPARLPRQLNSLLHACTNSFTSRPPQDNYEQAEIDQLCSRLDELQSQDILTPSTHVPTLPPLRFNTKYLVSEAYRMLSPIPLAGIKTPYVRCSYGHPTKSY